MNNAELNIRRMRYRLNRQGMLELDAWLEPLLRADFESPEVAQAVELLLQCEPPQLQAMMAGTDDIPEALQCWLK